MGMKTRIIRNHEQLLSACESLSEIPDESLPIEITVDHYKKKRSVEQNRRLWEILQQVSRAKPYDAEHSPEVWLEYFKGEFLPKTVVILGGNPKIVVGSSSHLKTQEFNDFMTQIEAWAAEHEIQLELLE